MQAILARSEQLVLLDETSLQTALVVCRNQLRLQGLTQKTVIEAFAIIREVSGRVLGMRHHYTQILASLSLLRGGIAAMATGAGKTLAATLAAATAGLAGLPVQVVPVNDYLSEREAE